MATSLTLWRGLPAHTLAATIFVVSTAIGCAPNSPRRPPIAPSAVPQSPALPISELSTPRLTADSASYLIVSHTKTLEESAPHIQSDSIVIHERVIARFIPDSIQQVFTIQLRSDSGYALPPDRTPPPETVSKDPQPATAAAIAAWHASGLQINHLMTPACPAASTLVSQLIPLLLARFILNTQTAIQVPDSIQYSTCTAGVRVANVLRFSPMSPADSSLAFDITSLSDSSRALPMHTRGTTSGKATVAPIAGATGIPSRLVVSLDALLRASSSTRRQQFRQQIRLEFVRQ